MDSITQIVLGGAVGEIVAGRKAGNRAILWGAVAGTIPDLDVITTPFVPAVTQLALHRGFSHSITFAILFAPVFGWLVHRIHRHAETTWRDWSWLGFWGLLTHTLLDCFTMYGTQLFQPLSNYPVAISSIFIIDPVYTIPLMIALIWVSFLQRSAPRRRRIMMAAMGFSIFYLLAGLAIKVHVDSVFQRSLSEQGKPFTRLFSSPTPLNIFLWTGMADAGEGVWVGQYSVFDDNTDVPFGYINKNSTLIAGKMQEPAVERLMWFSRGYYTVERRRGELYYNDLRFGRSDIFLQDNGDYVFSFHLLRDPQNPSRFPDFQRRRPRFEMSGALVDRLINRIKGQDDLFWPSHRSTISSKPQPDWTPADDPS